MARNPERRAGKARFTGIPHHIMDSENYALLDGWGVKLMLDLAKQYNRYNNGDLSLAWSQMRERGWRSKGTLEAAKNRLLELGFIEQTRQGWRKKCSLFALTWEPIDECKGKLDVKPTERPSNRWKEPVKN